METNKNENALGQFLMRVVLFGVIIYLLISIVDKYHDNETANTLNYPKVENEVSYANGLYDNTISEKNTETSHVASNANVIKVKKSNNVKHSKVKVKKNKAYTKMRAIAKRKAKKRYNTVVTYSSRCMATTKKGTQCKRNAQPGRNYCWQH